MFAEFGVGPLIARFENDERVRNTWRHGVGGDVGGASFGKYDFNFFHRIFQRGFDMQLHPRALLDTGAGDAHGVHGYVAFIEPWDEHLSKPRKLQPRRAQQSHGRDEHHGALTQREIQHGRVCAARGEHQFIFLFRHFAAHEQCHHRGHKGERQHKSSGERENHGQRHRVK